MEEDREWGWLPTEILHSILDKLRPTEDVIRFSAVCREWHSVAASNFRSRSLHHQVPLMMSRAEGRIGELQSVTQKKKYKFRLPLPENIIKCCCSSMGWLIMVDSGMAIVLFNPWSGNTVTFPPIRGRIDLEKGSLSADPGVHPDDYVLMVIYNYRLAFIKSGDEDWTYIIDNRFRSDSINDIIYWKSRFYAMDFDENLASIEINKNLATDFQVKIVDVPPKASISASTSTTTSFKDAVTNRVLLKKLEHEYLLAIVAVFLAESCEGDLLCVIKIETNLGGTFFWVYEIADGKGGNVGWAKREDLGDSALFVGNNYSISVSASDFPGCQANSIYFLDKEDEAEAVLNCPKDYIGPFHMGVYNLEHHSISRDYQLTTSERLMFSTPIWIVPTFI